MKHPAPTPARMHRRARHRIGLALACCATATSVLVGTGVAGATPRAASDAGVAVRIADVEGGDAYYLALQDGTLQAALAKYGATAKIVSTFPAEAPALQVLASGAADFTTGSITATIGGLSGASQVEVFAYTPDGGAPVPGEAILVKANSGIDSLKQLEGKTVAVNQAGSGEYMLDQALAHNNISESSVKKVDLQVPQGAAAFAAGQVTGWATFSTYIPLAVEKYGAKILLDGNQVASHNDAVEVVNSSFAKAHPELVKAVLQVLAAESAKTKAHPKAYDTFLETTDHLTPGGVLSYANKSLQVWQPVGPAQQKRFQQVANFFYKEGAVPSDVNFAGKVFDDQ